MNMWRCVCPCGEVKEYSINGLPEVDTKFDCGKDHWVIKFE